MLCCPEASFPAGSWLIDRRSGVRGEKANAEEYLGVRLEMRTTVNIYRPSFLWSLHEMTSCVAVTCFPVTEHRKIEKLIWFAAYLPFRGPFKYCLVFIFSLQQSHSQQSRACEGLVFR